MDVKPFSVILFCHAEFISEPHHTFSVILAPFVILPSPSEGFRTLLHAFKKHLQRRRKRAFKALFPNRMRLFALSMLYLRNYFLGLNLYTFSPPTFKSSKMHINSALCLKMLLYPLFLCPRITARGRITKCTLKRKKPLKKSKAT